MNPKACVLVVDDERGIRDSVKRMLEKQQYEVQVAENGKDALDILRQRKVNVMLTDLVMPIMTGMDLLKASRAVVPDTEVTEEPEPSPERVAQAIHPDPKQIIERALPTCMDCHEELEDDESLPKLFDLLDDIAKAEQYYVQTGNRLDRVGQGVLLVDNQRFKFEDAKTHLIELAPLQHALDNTLVREKVAELNTICEEVNAELDTLVEGLRWRYRALGPIWVFALFFGSVLYAKYKLLKRAYVKPLPRNPD